MFWAKSIWSDTEIQFDHTRTSHDGYANRYHMNPFITNIALQAFNQQIDDSNHEMMNMITIQMANVFNPMIENIIAFYQALARQLDWITCVWST